MTKLEEIVRVEKLGTYVPSEKITQVHAAIIQSELRNIQILLLNIIESLIDGQR